jgi:copper homeostasis protein
MTLEICVDNVEDAIKAANSGAHRLELCTELSCGGITPSFGFVKQVIENVQIPVHVLIRPRAGNFVYSKNELAVMQYDIEQLSKLNCSGFVLGVLLENATIDIEATKMLVQLADEKPVTFHKAFDCTNNAFIALDDVIKTGCKYILTSGLASNAVNGINNLKAIITAAKSDIIIMPGGSIRSANLELLKSELNATYWHSAAKVEITEAQKLQSENGQKFSFDSDEIKKMLNILSM